MRVIWKFPLENRVHNNVQMPKGAQVVHVAAQFEKPCLWALVDPDAEPEVRRFGIAATGQNFDEAEAHYVGTFMLAGGAFLGHVVEPIATAESCNNVKEKQ